MRSAALHRPFVEQRRAQAVGTVGVGCDSVEILIALLQTKNTSRKSFVMVE